VAASDSEFKIHEIQWNHANGLCIAVLAVGVKAVEQPNPPASPKPDDKDKDKKPDFRAGAVRYQVKDVDRSVEFYTKHLGFKVAQQFGAGTPFASVSNGGLTLWLSGPKSSGARPLPDGRKEEPGGWNRIVLEVDDLPSRVEAMKKAALHFRNEIEKGPGGMQIQLEDPRWQPHRVVRAGQVARVAELVRSAAASPDILLWADGAMKSLSARAWFALAILAAVMGLLLFVPAGTVCYWQVRADSASLMFDRQRIA
jgi:glyoxylase I family protein